MYIKTGFSEPGLVLQYKPYNDYQVVLEYYNSTNTNQQWYAFESSFPEYYYIANSTINDPFMKVVAAGNSGLNPLYLEPMSSGLNLSQLWIFRQPAIGTDSNNPAYFVVMSAKTGLVWIEKNGLQGGYIQVYKNINGYYPEHFYFYN